jgi:Transglycosylase-like domain
VCAAGVAVSAPAAESRPVQELFAPETDAAVSPSRLPATDVQRDYLKLYEKTNRRGGEPGRNIPLRGVATKDGRVRSAARAAVRKSIGVLKRVTVPASAVPGGTTAVSPQLAAIAECESGGDPTAIGGGGLYRGKYQFTYETWASVGGTGDPAAAPEAEQDARAAALLARDGAGHWPACGG